MTPKHIQSYETCVKTEIIAGRYSQTLRRHSPTVAVSRLLLVPFLFDSTAQLSSWYFFAWYAAYLALRDLRGRQP